MLLDDLRREGFVRHDFAVHDQRGIGKFDQFHRFAHLRANGMIHSTEAGEGEQSHAGNKIEPPCHMCRAERDFDQIFRAQPRRLSQNRPGDRDLVIVSETADHSGRRLGDRGELTAHFSKRHARTDIRDRPDLDRSDEAFEDVVEQLDLLAIEGAGGQQKQIRHALDCFQALFGRAGVDGCVDFVDNRKICGGHRSS